MKRILMSTLFLALFLTVALGAAPAAQAGSCASPLAAQPPLSTDGAGPVLLTPAASSAPADLPAGPLDGARFLADEECEASCFQQYMECAMGCAACDQCSCQLALCRSGCGVPYTGC